MDSLDMYVPNMQGTLIHLQEDDTSRFRFEIWFDYTRQAMNLIREGAMLAVPNFATDGTNEHCSILEVVSLLPMHYALGQDTQGYPGFVIEAAKSAMNDWEEQESESTEDTTKIRCIAIPTNFEIVQKLGGNGSRAMKEEPLPKLQEESNLPMIGSTARLLGPKLTEHVVNYGIGQHEDTIIAGSLIRDANVHIRMRVEDLLRTHFGIFAFTGAGKSNLITLLVSSLLDPCGECESCARKQPCKKREPIKLVIFDLMGEYSALLAEQLSTTASACWVAIDEETLSGSVAKCLRESAAEQPQEPKDRNAWEQSIARAAQDLCRTGLFPRALARERMLFAAPYRRLFEQHRIKIYQERTQTIGEVIAGAHKDKDFKNTMGNAGPAVHSLLDRLEREYKDKTFEQASVGAVLQQVETVLSEAEDVPSEEVGNGRRAPRSNNLTDTARNNLRLVKTRIEEHAASASARMPMPEKASITVPQLVRALNASETSGLYVIQSHDPDKLRHFAALLGSVLFEERRKTGQIAPLVSFIFDEADEFIPQSPGGTYAESAALAKTLARRGRKFGLGIGIATQRVRFLDTSIMAQPHTYFVSKMPRKSDREAVGEVFGVSEDMFRQTFKFKKGDWLMMSYDATGLEAVPLPIHCPDANERIIEYVKKLSTAKVGTASVPVKA